jgi:hypothetical protein
MSRTRSLLAIGAALVASAFAAAPASAETGPSGCTDSGSSSVFSPWVDYASYFLAPDGGFENGADGWSLDGASVVSGNESYAVSGAGSNSLSLEAGDSATSPAVCVGIEHPTFRYFARRVSGASLSSSIRVQVVLADGTAITVGSAAPSSSWNPSPVTLIGANLLPLLTGDTNTEVSFRFTALSGSWQVDDVYVDPAGSH